MTCQTAIPPLSTTPERTRGFRCPRHRRWVIGFMSRSITPSTGRGGRASLVSPPSRWRAGDHRRASPPPISGLAEAWLRLCHLPADEVPALLDGVVPPLADSHEVDLEPAEDPGHPLEGRREVGCAHVLVAPHIRDVRAPRQERPVDAGHHVVAQPAHLLAERRRRLAVPADRVEELDPDCVPPTPSASRRPGRAAASCSSRDRVRGRLRARRVPTSPR